MKKQKVLISVLIFVLLSFQIFSQTDNPKSGDQEEVEKIAKVLNAKPKITFVSEYAFEKNEIRFPSKYYVEEIYILQDGYRFRRSKTTIIYDNYKFFTCDTKVNIR